MDKKKIIILSIILAVSAAVVFYFLTGKNNKNYQNNPTDSYPKSVPKTEQTKEEVKFTHGIFDPRKVSFIIPLGELNGGYEETQTINGVIVNIKMDERGNVEPLEVYAPTDMTLEDYSYFAFGTEPPNWHLGFRIAPGVKMSVDHITWVPPEVAEATPGTPSSAYVPPQKKLAFKAGELIAKTTGTSKAHNWNIYMRDSRQKNIFVNQERYEKIKESYDYVNAVCPFAYYEEAKKQSYLALMGFSAPGQSKTCGANSKDVKGAIAGLWHLSQEGVGAAYQNQYATPFSIYQASSGEIVIYEIDRQRFILGVKNPTFQDPAIVTDSHCYSLTQYGDSQPKGYAYFKIVSDREMKLSYSPTGSCPAAFPENSATYYR